MGPWRVAPPEWQPRRPRRGVQSRTDLTSVEDGDSKACMKKDYYLILRLTPEATAEEIRSAYRRLAIELSPDLSGFGSDPFLELQEAYSVLSDPMRRAIYDREAEEFPARPADSTWAGEDLIAAMHSAEPLTPAQPVSRLEEI